MKILTAGDILGLFEERFQKFGYMYIIADQRTAMVHDFSVKRSYAEIILFWIQKLIPCCFVNSCLELKLPRKLRKPNNLLMFITDHDENSLSTTTISFMCITITKYYSIAKAT